jgi:hypothetical protein
VQSLKMRASVVALLASLCLLAVAITVQGANPCRRRCCCRSAPPRSLLLAAAADGSHPASAVLCCVVFSFS